MGSRRHRLFALPSDHLWQRLCFLRSVERSAENLRCSPTNFILQSRAMADLIVGLILSPTHVYLLFSSAMAQKSRLSFHEISSLSITLFGVSLAHVTLLSIDRHFAVVKPLKYKFIRTRRRINLALSFLWLCYICFGIAAFLLKNSIFVGEPRFYCSNDLTVAIHLLFLRCNSLPSSQKSQGMAEANPTRSCSRQPSTTLRWYGRTFGKSYGSCNFYFSSPNNTNVCPDMLGIFLCPLLLFSGDSSRVHLLGCNT